MFVKQVSIFVENKKGTIADTILLLGENGINIRALSVADTSDYGILRLIVSEPERAQEILKKNNYTVKLTDVIAFAVSDKPGGLAEALKALHDNDIEIAYVYSFVGHYKNNAVGIISTPKLEDAVNVLHDNGILIIASEQIYKS